VSGDLATAPVVTVNSVNKNFGALHVLKDVSLSLKRSDIMVVIGGSGSGKSTLLRCVAGLETIDSGSITFGVDDEPTTASSRRSARRQARHRVGMVFQSYNLFPHRTALQNITEAPIYVKGVPKDEAVAQARKLLEQVGLSDREDHYPAHLSGGQQQRVAIARALALEPHVLLFDEVTSALDPELTAEVLATMASLAQDGQTMMVVTHEMGFARRVGTDAIFMADGRILERGSPEQVLSHPQDPLAQRFIKSVLQME
jgi:ABC-type polar amino acid transport system ATPase subunit